MPLLPIEIKTEIKSIFPEKAVERLQKIKEKYDEKNFLEK
jgi:hypothetical protein